MRTYPLLNGETLNDNFVITLPFVLRNKIETECRDAWKDLFKLDPTLETSSPYVPYETWLKSKEGNLHSWLAELLFAVVNSIPGNPPQHYTIWLSQEEYSRVWCSLQAQRRHVMGQRRKYAKGHQNLKEYRKFRSWWLSAKLSELYGLEFNDPCPIDKVELGIPTTRPLEMAKHFEEWTGYSIPPELMKFVNQQEEAWQAAQKASDATISDDLPRLAA